MKKNVAAAGPRLTTHEGAPADRISAEKQLRRSVLACMLWEDSFYESGVSIADRIAALVPQVDPVKVGLLAVDAREQYKLRHAPLWLVLAMVRAGGLHRRYAGSVLPEVIQRADELSEFLALYWGATDRRKVPKNRRPLAASVKRGLAAAFRRFDPYQLGKYRGGGVKLRDVMFLAHPKPHGADQAAAFAKLADRSLVSQGTWERTLSAGEGAKTTEEKRARWEEMLAGRKLGALALLRNLRNMIEVGVPQANIEEALRRCNPERVLPFRFITAARHAPRLEPALEPLMLRCLADREGLPGKTVLLIDHSASMKAKISAKSEMTRFEAACALAILARELCREVIVLAFSTRLWEIPPRRGFGLRDALAQGEYDNTLLGAAITASLAAHKPDRLIVLTDEESADPVPALLGGDLLAYMVNVSSSENGVGYKRGWNHVTGWSEAILDYIAEVEKADAA